MLIVSKPGIINLTNTIYGGQLTLPYLMMNALGITEEDVSTESGFYAACEKGKASDIHVGLYKWNVK